MYALWFSLFAWHRQISPQRTLQTVLPISAGPVLIQTGMWNTGLFHTYIQEYHLSRQPLTLIRLEVYPETPPIHSRYVPIAAVAFTAHGQGLMFYNTLRSYQCTIY